MKKIGILVTIIIMAVLFAVSASAETEGYYTYEIVNGEATITDVDTSISGDITIPSTLGGYSVTTIGDYAFYECTFIENLRIPDGVTYIGSHAFYHCDKLTSITIPDGVTSIGKWTFAWCGLTSVTIGNGVTSIGDGAFWGCMSLTSITIPNGVTSIGDGAFAVCRNITSITIPDSVTTIGNSAFSNCYNLTSITLPNSVTSIGELAFDVCKSLTSIIIPDSVTSIGYGAFSSCESLTSITVDTANEYYSNDSYGVLFNKDKSVLIQYPAGNPSFSYAIPVGVTSIGKYAIYGCRNLSSLTISESVTSIGDYTISYSYLENITIPVSVTSIGEDGYSYSELDVYYGGTAEQWSKVTINDNIRNARIHFSVAQASHHYLPTNTVAPTCENYGYTTYVCGCGHSREGDITQATGHSYNANKVCKSCGYVDCYCKCHKTGIANFFWKIANFFNKLFKVKNKQMCACGIAHY